MSVTIFAECLIDAVPSLPAIRRALKEHVRGRIDMVSCKRYRFARPNGDHSTTVYLITEVGLPYQTKDTRVPVVCEVIRAMRVLVGSPRVVSAQAICFDTISTTEAMPLQWERKERLPKEYAS